MGNSTILDIIGSVVIAGFLLMIVLNLYGTISNATFVTNNELVVQTNLVTLVTLMEHDFRRLGYCANPVKVADPTLNIKAASAHSISFVTDVNCNGNLDTLTYSVSDTSALHSTTNPHDMFLLRTIDGVTQRLSLGLTMFNFSYYDVLGDSIPNPVADPRQIYTMQLSIELQSPAAYDTTYSYAYWRQLRLTSQNLRNR
ncbi:MAG TPA: hypothetical protein VMW43_05415 [Bacteroidota bacterium]|nr:hypothetical protein [Bacteroidota bacterium]